MHPSFIRKTPPEHTLPFDYCRSSLWIGFQILKIDASYLRDSMEIASLSDDIDFLLSLHAKGVQFDYIHFEPLARILNAIKSESAVMVAGTSAPSCIHFLFLIFGFRIHIRTFTIPAWESSARIRNGAFLQNLRSGRNLVPPASIRMSGMPGSSKGKGRRSVE